jgi:diguanylate cyclase (GGDEF)-like protein/PAS domain S-box-containing protein
MRAALPHPEHSTVSAAAIARTRVDCLHQLAGTAPASGISIIAGATLMALWLWDLAPSWLLVPWLIALLALGALRFVFSHLVRRHFNSQHVRRWEQAYALLTGATGLVWGMMAWIPIADPDHSKLFVIVVVLFCILLVSGSTLVASSLALTSFAVALALPLLARTFTLEARLALLFGLGLAMMAWVMISAVRTHRRTLIRAMLGRNEVDELLQQQKVIFESAGEGIVFLKPKPAYVVSCNRRFAELFGYPHEAMIGMAPWRWHPNRQQWKTLVEASLPAIVAGRAYHQVFRLRRADGSQFWGDVTGMAVAASDLSAGTVWVVSDITDKRAAEAALRDSEVRFRDLVKLSSDLYWEQDTEFRFRHFDGPEELRNRLPLDRMLGHTRWEVQDISGVDKSKWQEHIASLEAHLPFKDFTYQINGSDGRRYWLNASGNPLFDDAGTFIGYHGTASDITLRIEAEERHRHLAYHDTLTRLPNRRLLTDRLDQAIRSASRNGRRIALLLLDLDGFKQINDRHGHAAGDRVLEAVAARLRDAVRDADTVARMGGDEFVVLLPDVEHLEDAVKVADKIHDSICKPITDGGARHTVGTSIGISVFPDHGETPDTLLHRADHAMYHGKSHGGKTTRIYDTGTLN